MHPTSRKTSHSSTATNGLLAAVVFLDLNGVIMRDPEGRLYDAMIALAKRRLDKARFAGLLRELAKDAPPAEGA